MSDTETLTVHILGKDYQVACPADEREALLSSARELDSRMKVIRQSGSVIGVERIAVMAALNLAHEVLASDNSDNAADGELIDDLYSRVDELLAQ